MVFISSASPQSHPFLSQSPPSIPALPGTDWQPLPRVRATFCSRLHEFLRGWLRRRLYRAASLFPFQSLSPAFHIEASVAWLATWFWRWQPAQTGRSLSQTAWLSSTPAPSLRQSSCPGFLGTHPLPIQTPSWVPLRICEKVVRLIFPWLRV